MVKKTTKELRKFGFIMASAFALIGCLMLWRDKPLWIYFLGTGGFFLIFGLILPRVLAPIEWAWMKLAYALSIIMTHILVTLTFYLIITPMGLIMRLLGKDPLQLKFDKSKKSYWIDVDPNGACSRPDKPY